MSSIVDGPTFDQGMQNGLTSYGAGTVEVLLVQDDGTNFTAASSNPKSKAGSDYGLNNSTVAIFTNWGSWESAADNQTVDRIEVSMDVGISGMTHWLTIDGGDFDNTHDIDTGAQVDVQPGAIDFGSYEGLARILLNGVGAFTYDCEVLDGNGNVLATNSGIAWDWDNTLRGLTLTSNVQFTNNGWSSTSVEQVRIRTNGTNSLCYDDPSISETVPDGATLTFTQLQQDITI